MKPLAFVFTLLLCLGSALRAQQPAGSPPPLPPGPLINKAPDYSQWVVTIKAVGEKPAPSSDTGSAATTPGPEAMKKGEELRISSFRTGKIRREVRAKGGQVISDIWAVDGASVTIDPRTQIPQVSMGGSKAAAAEFPGFEWIAEKNYVGVQAVGGKKCLVFKDRVSLLIVGSDVALDEKVDAVAYIDLDTKFPVILQRGDVYSYQFGPKPQADLVPPPEITQAVAMYRKRLQRAAAGPAREP